MRYEQLTGEEWDYGEDRGYNPYRDAKSGRFTSGGGGNGLTNKVESDTIQIGKSLGAKAKNYNVKLPDGSYAKLAEGTRIEKIQVIAGKGRNRKIDEIDILLYKYNGTKEEYWQKKKGVGYIDLDKESYKKEWLE